MTDIENIMTQTEEIFGFLVTSIITPHSAQEKFIELLTHLN